MGGRTTETPPMNGSNSSALEKISRSWRAQLALYASVLFFTANLSALVDFFLHPEIGYLDEEHLIVGGVTALFTGVLFGALVMYVRHLRKALDTIHTLESFLPICAGCKKIRKSGADPKDIASWQPIESYFSERTETRFSHGICPDCKTQLYPPGEPID
jgi:hypothetical protein